MSSLVFQTGPWLGDLEIELPESMRVSGAVFDDLCRHNPDLKAELTKEGKLIIMSPTGGSSGWRNSELTWAVENWARTDGSGIVFDSSTVFVLPNGARRGPDVAWIKRNRWNALTAEQQDAFPPICPDFVIELRSKTDRLEPLQDKLAEFIANGASLGLLVDPVEQTDYLYRPAADPQVIEKPEAVSCDPELPGLEIDLSRIWSGPA